MKYFIWNSDKNEQLKRERDILFEQIVIQIEEGKLHDILEHPNQQKYKDQKIFVVELNEYIHLVPFVEDEEYVFLKTIIPSRKATKKYLKR
jgi:uncharacterized DUF497 family protein